MLSYGWLCAGFPRSVAQAVALDQILEETQGLGPIEKLINLKVSDAVPRSVSHKQCCQNHVAHTALTESL